MQHIHHLITTKTFWKFCFLLVLAVLLYLSFKPNPAIQDVDWMPGSLAELFDLYDHWKNFVGFMAMGFTGFMAWPDGVGSASFSLRRRRLHLALLLCGTIVVIELIQIPIPTRWCDEKDILAGSLGVWVSWPLANGCRCVLEKCGAKRMA